MGKKKGIVSKHSRAARRGALDHIANEASDLSKVPKLESSVKKQIIRSTILSENLLQKRIDKKKLRKASKPAIKSKEDVLNAKIQNRIKTYNLIKTTRSLGWDKINGLIKEEMTKGDEISEKEKQQQEEDEYVKQFFQQEPKQGSSNAFDILEESEA